MEIKKTLPMFALLLVFYANNVFANQFEPLADVLCAVARAASSGVAKALATVGVVFIGFRAFIGKLDWATVLIGAFSVFLIFGVPKILEIIHGIAKTGKTLEAC